MDRDLGMDLEIGSVADRSISLRGGPPGTGTGTGGAWSHGDEREPMGRRRWRWSSGDWACEAVAERGAE